MTLTITEVKNYLNIDFDDNDEYLQTLLDAAKERASSIMGIPQTTTVVDDLGNELTIDNPDLTTDEFNHAILNDIEFAYQPRGEKESTSWSAMET